MADEGKMEGGRQANNSTDHHDGDSVCRGTQLVPIHPHKSAKQPIPATSFHCFLHLPWELRRLVWVFALPRSVFMSTILEPTECVPYPPMGLACCEAHIVAKEFGSMVTAWNKSQVNRCWEISLAQENRGIPWPEDVPKKADMCVRTWVSGKLDTLVLDSDDDMVPYWREDHEKCDFVDFIGIAQSPTTRLVVYNQFSSCTSEDLDHLYQTHFRSRREIFLCVKSINLRFGAQDSSLYADLNISRRPGNRAQVVSLDELSVLKKHPKLWFECWTPEMQPYTAWVVEEQAYEERLVSPQARFLLQIVDNIISSHESIRHTGKGSTCRGHEVMDGTDRLKQDHPLVQELDIKLPQVVPVVIVALAGHDDR